MSLAPSIAVSYRNKASSATSFDDPNITSSYEGDTTPFATSAYGPKAIPNVYEASPGSTYKPDQTFMQMSYLAYKCKCFY